MNQQSPSTNSIGSQDQKDSLTKSKSWLTFINEKLNQWPLWVKLTSSEKQQEPKKQQAKTKAKLKFIKVSSLPWHQFFQRGPLRTIYHYYHCPEDKMTYFYPTEPNEGNQTHKQISEIPPQNYQYNGMRRFGCIMPTETAIKLIEEDKLKNIW